MPTPMTPQAALEQAVVNLLQSSPAGDPPGLGYDRLFCGRQFDACPPPAARGKWYAAVWSDNARKAGSNGALKTALDEEFGLVVTVTVELVGPSDQWQVHRDYLEARANEIVETIQGDVYANTIVNAANELAGFRGAASPDGSRQAGFFGGLYWTGSDAVVEAGPDHLGAKPDSGRSAIYQNLRFTGAMRVRAIGTLRG